ncbi:MAG: NAD(+)--dinitrogen-reductase ADP-D-ribosyltransferase [Magnetospiraceae bacterium]
MTPSLPRWARLPINRCNLPSVILGGLAFQEQPSVLEIDCVRPLHEELFAMLRALQTHDARAERFMDYMTVHFMLHELEEAGLGPRVPGSRANADYLRMMRGWLFDSDGREGAVLKGWVESRFGLLPRYHGGAMKDVGEAPYQRYITQRSAGFYNTNALEGQLDLLYTYCQYELAQGGPAARRITLHRGTNGLEEYDILTRHSRREADVLLNNLNSFTLDRDKAGEFGDLILTIQVPAPKIFFYSDLLPGRLHGEQEYVVIGGVYRADIRYD